MFLNLSQLDQWIMERSDLFGAPAIFLLRGEMAAGKTTLVQAVVKSFGPFQDDVSSPTFALHQGYRTRRGVVDHMDLYRLKSDADLESSGFFDLLMEHEHYFFVEWADRLPREIFQGVRPVFELELLKDRTDPSRREIRVTRAT